MKRFQQFMEMKDFKKEVARVEAASAQRKEQQKLDRGRRTTAKRPANTINAKGRQTSQKPSTMQRSLGVGTPSAKPQTQGVPQNQPKAKPNFAMDKQREAGKKMQPKAKEYTQPSLKPATRTSTTTEQGPTPPPKQGPDRDPNPKLRASVENLSLIHI